MLSEGAATGPVGAAEPATFVFADIAGFTALTEAHPSDSGAGTPASSPPIAPTGRRHSSISIAAPSAVPTLTRLGRPTPSSEGGR